MYQKQLTINKLLEKNVFPKLKVSEANITDFYDSRIHASHILVENESTAKDIIAQLAKVSKSKLTSTFMSLAEKYSIDPSAADNGGDLGEFGKGQMVAPFEEAAFALAENQYTKVPVNTQFGYHVILRLPKNETLEEQHDSIKEYLLTQIKTESVPKYVEQVRSKADIQVLYTEP
jgi:parvulin-like peptidyl-prolyl isomerase